MKCKFHSCDKGLPPYKGVGKQPEFCSKSCKTKHAVNTHRRKRKQMFVDYKGGSCCVCGYNKSNAALQFHHLDPNEKEFQLTKSVTLSFDKAKIELDKCILVCANCHAEIHQDLIDLSQYIKSPID